ncbi:hypothetical protein V8E36_004043 [Tilletia maclaganii]
MASPYYLGDARPPPTNQDPGSGGAPTPAASARPYAYDDDDDDGDGAWNAPDRGGAGGANLQSYQSGTSRPGLGGASSYSSSQPLPPHPPPSRHLGPQNPVLFDAGGEGASAAQSPLLGYGAGAPPLSSAAQHSQQQQQQSSGPRGFAASRRHVEDAHASYSTSFNWSLSSACAVAYAFPPLTSVAVLILETTNDLARFHAYQAGLLGVAAWVLLWVMRSILGWYSLSVIVGMGLLGWFWVCASNAANAAPTLARVPYLPHAGPLAEQWVGEE